MKTKDIAPISISSIAASILLGFVVLSSLYFLGSSYMSWFDNFHIEWEEINKCEQEFIADFQKEGVPVPYTAEQLHNICQEQISKR